jgi:hypothetical protein
MGYDRITFDTPVFLRGSTVSKNKMLQAKELINQKRYDEARKILVTIDHPAAYRWLDNLDVIAPPGTKSPPAMPARKGSKSAGSGGGKVLLLIGGIMLVIVLGVGAYFGALTFFPFLTDDTNCGAQSWWNSVNGQFDAVVNFNPYELMSISNTNASISVDKQKATLKIKELKDNRYVFEQASYPGCVATARASLLKAIDETIIAADTMDPTVPQLMFKHIYDALVSSEAAAQDLNALSIDFWGSDVKAVNSLLDTQCPAHKWLVENLYVKNQFFTLVFVTDNLLYAPDLLAAFTNYLYDLDLQYYRFSTTSAPPCLEATKQHMLKVIDSFKSIFWAAYGGDIYGMEVHATALDTSWDALMNEIDRLGVDSHLFGRVVKITP